MDHAREPDGYEAYRLAGELFGRMQSAITFGELTMHVNSHAAVYQWTVAAKKGRYCNEQSVTWDSLAGIQNHIKSLADDIVDQWKQSHKNGSVEI